MDKTKNIGKSLLFTLGVMFVLVTLLESTVSIRSGNVGVITRFGKVNRVAKPGLNLKIPFVESVIVYKTQKIVYETSDNPTDSMADYTDYSVDTNTKDGQSINIRYSVRFSVDPEEATWIASNIGNESDIVEKIVKMGSRIYVRGVAREYEAADLYTGNLIEVQNKVAEQLKTSFEENGLIFDEFGIRSIQFSNDYIAAIEQKQIEKEKVTTEKYIAEQEEYKKQAAITRAQAEAETQRLLQSTITDQILQKMWIEKWNGQLPNVVTGDSQDMILDMNNIQSKK